MYRTSHCLSHSCYRFSHFCTLLFLHCFCFRSFCFNNASLKIFACECCNRKYLVLWTEFPRFALWFFCAVCLLLFIIFLYFCSFFYFGTLFIAFVHRITSVVIAYLHFDLQIYPKYSVAARCFTYINTQY